MNCKNALERLLEAEPAELAGHGDSELATHVRACARCAAVTVRLLDGQALLEARLAAFGPRTSADDALEQAFSAGAGEAGTDAGLVRGRAGSQRRRRLRAAAAALPLAAAAALAVLAIGREPRATPVPLPIREPRMPTAPAVRIPAGHDAAIFRTANPEITVVWIY